MQLPITEGSVIETHAGEWFALVSEPEGTPPRWLGGDKSDDGEPDEFTGTADDVAQIVVIGVNDEMPFPD